MFIPEYQVPAVYVPIAPPERDPSVNPQVPKLPIEYVHRHRLMKQVVSCLLDQTGQPRDADDEVMVRNHYLMANICCFG